MVDFLTHHMFSSFIKAVISSFLWLVFITTASLTVIPLKGVSQAGLAGTAPARFDRPPDRTAAEQPNILIIMADDLDSRQLSCYGGTNLKTPHIDSLVAQGLKFNNMIASEAMCIPTRASLFTGLYPAHHGAYQNHKQVYDSLQSVVHYMNALGYRVGLSGKNHVTTPREVFPFDIIPGFEPNCVSPTDDYFLDSLEQYISSRGAPFCLFVMSINPHGPWTVGDPSEFDPANLDLPPNWIDTRETRERFAAYLAEVRRLDNQVGDVLDMLKRTGEEKNTVVIFLGEQGPQFPGGKWTLWDQGQHSSMIVRWPGFISGGAVSDALVQYEDLVPTLIEIAGGSPPPDLDGASFLPVLAGARTAGRSYAYGIHNNIPEGPAYPIRSIRDTRYKLIMNLLPEKEFYIKYMMNPEKKGSYYAGWLRKAQTDPQARRIIERLVHRPALEFYDLQRDPDEMQNLAGDPAYAQHVEKYKAALLNWMREQGDAGAALDKEFKRK